MRISRFGDHLARICIGFTGQTLTSSSIPRSFGTFLKSSNQYMDRTMVFSNFMNTCACVSVDRVSFLRWHGG